MNKYISCEQCYYWDQVEDRPKGHCRCKPPELVIKEVGGLGRWPLTNPTDWCGEFTRRRDVGYDRG